MPLRTYGGPPDERWGDEGHRARRRFAGPLYHLYSSE